MYDLVGVTFVGFIIEKVERRNSLKLARSDYFIRDIIITKHLTYLILTKLFSGVWNTRFDNRVLSKEDVIYIQNDIQSMLNNVYRHNISHNLDNTQIHL